VRFRKDKRYKSGYQISLKINITQKNKKILEEIRNALGYGNIYFHRRDELWYLEIYKLNEIENFVKNIIPYSIIKREKLNKLLKIIEEVKKKKHLSQRGLKKIKMLWLGPETGANTP